MSEQLIALAECQTIDKSGRVIARYAKGQDVGILRSNNNDGTFLINDGEYIIADKVAIKMSPGLSNSKTKVVAASRDNNPKNPKSNQIKIIQLYPWLSLVLITIAVYQFSKERNGVALSLGIIGTALLIKKK